MSKFARVLANGPPSAAGELSRIETSIGRPIDPSWANGFEEAFNYLATSSGFHLIMRPVPGVVYISESDYGSHGVHGYRAGENRDEIAERIKTQVDNWCLKGVLNAAAQRRASFDRYREVDTRHRRGNIRAVLMLSDEPDDFYSRGFLLTGEREAVRRELGLRIEQQSSTHDIPKLQLQLGEIHSDDGPVPRSFMQEVDALMAKTVELGPVGPLRGIH